jgi:hypothetical protein
MSTTFGANSRSAPTENSTASPPSRRASGSARPALRIYLTPDVAEHLDRYVPAISATVRATFAPHGGTDDVDQPSELIIDLSQVVELPQSQLILLLNLSRRIIGNDVTITLSGVRPTILGPLVGFELPDGVVVFDARGRRWTRAR